MKKFIAFSVFTLLSILLSSTAFAVPPHLPDLIQGGNRWTITFYDDSSPLHNQWATQGLCFYYAGTVGTHQRYIWVSDTYPDWNGRATQEGDQIFMHGDFQWPFGNIDGGHDGMEWEIVTRSRNNEGAGHWKEWVENGRLGITIGFGNAKLVRTGFCAIIAGTDPKSVDPNVEMALEKYRNIAPGQDDKGNMLTNPMGINLNAQGALSK